MKNYLRIIVFVLLGILMLSPITYAEDATLNQTYSAIDRTDQMTAIMIKNAAKNEVTVVSEYVKVQIGGKTVLVDPCRVINY